MPTPKDYGDAVVVRHGGTDLDHEIRGAVNTVRGLKNQVRDTKAYLERITAEKTKEIERLEAGLQEAEARLKELVERKKTEEPGTGVPGLPRTRVPDGMTVEEWHKLRRQGKHKKYLTED